MGVRASLTEIEPDTFERMVAGDDADISNCESHSLDKAWSDLNEALRQAGPPLDKVLTGDRLHPDCSQSFEEFYNGGHDFYVGLVSPELVRTVADALVKCNPPERSPDREDSEFEYSDYVAFYFRELTQAYRGAASRRNALMIVIA